MIEIFIKWAIPGLPDGLVSILTRLIVLWGEQEGDFSTRDINTEAVIANISPRPLLIMHGGSDDKIGGNVGQQLFAAVAEHNTFWLCPECGHVDFQDHRPEEYPRTALSFSTSTCWLSEVGRPTPQWSK